MGKTRHKQVLSHLKTAVAPLSELMVATKELGPGFAILSDFSSKVGKFLCEKITVLLATIFFNF